MNCPIASNGIMVFWSYRSQCEAFSMINSSLLPIFVEPSGALPVYGAGALSVGYLYPVILAKASSPI